MGEVRVPAGALYGAGAGLAINALVLSAFAKFEVSGPGAESWLDTVLTNQLYLSPNVAGGAIDVLKDASNDSLGFERLTSRQREMLQLFAEGKSMKEVASVLKVTPRTVAFHKYHIMQDLGFKTNADLIQFAVKSRIVVG